MSFQADAFQNDAFQVAITQVISDIITSTQVINLPIDYVLAGDQHEVRKGFAPWDILRNIFRE